MTKNRQFQQTNQEITMLVVPKPTLNLKQILFSHSLQIPAIIKLSSAVVTVQAVELFHVEQTHYVVRALVAQQTNTFLPM